MAGGLFKGGTGEIQDPYLIEDADDFFAIRKDPYAYYKLVSSINLLECSHLGPDGWVPSVFAGNLEGNGYSIENLRFHNTEVNYVGLFSYLRGTVRNLQLSGFDIEGQHYVGALAGQIEQSEGLAIENIAVVNSTIKGVSAVGSIAGGLYVGDARNSYSSSNVELVSGSAISKGGLFGYISSDRAIKAPVIENCFFSGEIIGSGNKGGIVGRADQAPVVINSYFDSKIVSANNYGEAKTEEEMLLKETYVNWDIPTANHIQKVWYISDGSLPELYFNASSKFLIFAEEKYYKLEGEDWVEIGEDLPTEEEFAAYGLSEGDLAGVPSYVWNKLRIHRIIEIVNLRDRYRVDHVYDHKVLENQGQVTDGFLLTTTLNLNDYGDALGRIYFKK